MRHGPFEFFTIHYSECSSCLRDYYHDVRFGIPPISKLLILRKPKTRYFVEGLTEVSVGIAKWSCEWDCPYLIYMPLVLSYLLLVGIPSHLYTRKMSRGIS
jgi:hypothetical protein